MSNAPAPTPSRAVYGFIFHLSFKLAFIIYLTWALVPEDWFRSIGITYLPKRYWAVTVPIYLLTVLTIFAFIIYPSLGLIMTPNIEDPHTVSDKYSLPSTSEIDHNEDDKHVKCCANSKTCKKKEFYHAVDKSFFIKKSVPPICDLNICQVSKHLYGENEI